MSKNKCGIASPFLLTRECLEFVLNHWLEKVLKISFCSFSTVCIEQEIKNIRDSCSFNRLFNWHNLNNITSLPYFSTCPGGGMVDTRDLKSLGWITRTSSSLVLGTIEFIFENSTFISINWTNGNDKGEWQTCYYEWQS